MNARETGSHFPFGTILEHVQDKKAPMAVRDAALYALASCLCASAAETEKARCAPSAGNGSATIAKATLKALLNIMTPKDNHLQPTPGATPTKASKTRHSFTLVGSYALVLHGYNGAPGDVDVLIEGTGGIQSPSGQTDEYLRNLFQRQQGWSYANFVALYQDAEDNKFKVDFILGSQFEQFNVESSPMEFDGQTVSVATLSSLERLYTRSSEDSCRSNDSEKLAWIRRRVMPQRVAPIPETPAAHSSGSSICKNLFDSECSDSDDEMDTL